MASDEALIKADAAAREAALDVTRSFIVQAPAGSGKTELLIQRYLRLLATVDAPEEVVAITFTRKAAAEMLDRVARALERARAGTPPNKAHERVTHDAAIAVLERDRALGWSLTAARSRMRIQTLDALCAAIVRQLPVTSGMGAAGAMARDDEAAELYRHAAMATLEWLGEAGGPAEVVTSVLSHLDNSVTTYVARIASMLRRRDQWLGITGAGAGDDMDAVRDALETNLERIVEDRLRAVAERFYALVPDNWFELARYAAENLRERRADGHAALALLALDGPPRATADDLAGWAGIGSLLLTNKGQWRKSVTATIGFPTTGKQEKAGWKDVIDVLQTDRELGAMLAEVSMLPPARYSDGQWRVLGALFDVLPLAVTELRRLFAERGCADYQEVAIAAAAALGSADAPGEVALRLDYRISHLLVDEMQDTSVAQYGLLETLTAGWTPGDGRSFFCVGDPMQSIYRFRDAEVGQFVRAREDGLAQLPLESLTLHRNFRSAERLVDWFNVTFGRVFPDSDDPASGTVTYTDSAAVAALAGQGEVSIRALRDGDVTDESRAVVDAVQSRLGADAGGRIAILVRARTQLPALLRELRGAGVEYEAVDIDRLTDLPEIIDVTALTRALAHRDDRAAWLAVLRGPLVGLTWRDLHALVADAPAATVWELLQDEARRSRLSDDACRRLDRCVPPLRRVLGQSLSRTLRDKVELAWLELGGAASSGSVDQVDNVYRFLDVIGRLERAGTLDDPLRLDDALAAERVSSRPTSACRVAVMTMHKAKGLEFEHVILPFLGRYTSTSEAAVLDWLALPGSDGGNDLIVSPIGPSDEADRDKLHQYITTRRRQSDLAELDRLLYVACTRAKGSLQLVASLSSQKNSDEISPPHGGSLLAHLWLALDTDFQGALEAGDSAAGSESTDDALVMPVLRRQVTDPVRPTPDRAPGIEPPASRQPERREVPYDWVGAVGRHAGTLVHRWLQRYAEQGMPATFDADAAAALTRAWARDLGASERLPAIERRVLRSLEAVHDDSRGRWLFSGRGHAELPLTGVLDDRIESVVVDRVRIDDDTHWIIDYKTSSHEGGAVEAFIARELERYRPQLERYVRLYRAFADPAKVRVALYFPLLERFEELAPSPGATWLER